METFRQIAADKATTMGHIQRLHLSEALTLVPPNALIKNMTEIINPLTEQIVSLKLNSHNLVEIRDLLLPKLLSGKLQVSHKQKRRVHPDIIQRVIAGQRRRRTYQKGKIAAPKRNPNGRSKYQF